MSSSYPICEVTWKDAWVDTIDITLAEAKELEPVMRTTVGYLIDIREDNGIVLCTDYYNGEEDSVNTPMFIPFGLVSEYKIIGISNDRLE